MSHKLTKAVKSINRSIAITGSAAAFLAAVSASSYAEQVEEEVMVKGIRGALEASIDLKREAVGFVDAITAEDIGKLPDSDVGESLGRIPGVSVGRAFGQGASVSIRGSDPQMTYTTLNGQSVASTGWFDQQAADRSFNYSMLPSELIGSMEVHKTPRADLTEGGIGGTVIVNTRKPMDLDPNTVFTSAKLTSGSVSDDNLELTGMYSWKDDSEKFGVLAAASVSEGDYIRRGIEADTRWASDVAPTTFVQERKRTALDFTGQFRPTDSLEFGVHVLSLELVGDNSNTSHYIFHDSNCTERNTDVTSGFNPGGVCLQSETSAENATDAFVQTWARVATMTSDTYALDFKYESDSVTVESVLGKTKAEGGTDMTTNFSYGWWTEGATLPQWTGSIDATGNQISIRPSSDQSVSVDNLPANVSPAGSWATSRGPNSDEETYFQTDLSFNLELGAINSFKTGVRLTDHEFEQATLRSVWADAEDVVSVPASQVYSGTISMGPNGWSHPNPNIGAMIANTRDNVVGWVEERPGYGLLKEENTALYGMFTFEGEGYSGDFGLRYISTDASATGYDLDGTLLADGDVAQNDGWGTERVTTKASYSDVLPSANIKFDLSDNLVLRTSVSQAITRANYENMFRGEMAGFQDTVAGNETVTFGDPGLLPQKSSQADIAIEYYYGDGNLMSVGFFTKDISNFITTDTEIEQEIGVVSPDSGEDSWTVNSFVNAGGGEIDGIELQLQHAFDNGFGTLINYTFADASAPAESFQDELPLFTLASEHTANVVAYWENESFSVRGAYNYRSEYIVRETGWYGNRMHDDYGTLDASFGWNASDNLKLTLEMKNLTETDDIQYGAADASTSVKDPLKEGYPAWSFMGERTIKLGVSFQL